MQKRLHQKLRAYLQKFNYIGIVFAVIFYCFSMLPSLLPRPALYQGIISGISILIGYAIGVGISSLSRWLLQRELVTVNVKNIAWRVLIISGLLLVFVFALMGGRWQDQVHQLVGEQPNGDAHAVLILLLGMVTFIILLAAARLLRQLTRIVNRQFAKVLPHRIAVSLGVLAIIMIFGWLTSGLFLKTFVATANRIYSSKNNTTPDGVMPTNSQLRSGGPNSVVAWDTLGYQGQSFIGTGPTQQQIADYSNTAALEPIRVYAGINSAPTAQARANLALRQRLERVGSNRKVSILLSICTVATPQ